MIYGSENLMRQGVSIVWDKNGKFFQIWQSDYNGDGKAHAEKIAAQVGGTVLHVEPEEF